MAEISDSIEQATPRPCGRVRRLLAILAECGRRPGRTLGVLALLTVILGSAGVAGLYLWSGHHLRAARRALELGHNGAAIRHLRCCRLVRADDPEVLLLCARAARRGGGWTEAEELLDRYWKRRGDDDALVLERLLLRATRGEVDAVLPLLQARGETGDLAEEALTAGLLYRFRLVDAAERLARWLTRAPTSTAALLARGRLHEIRDESEAAARVYRQLLEIDPEHDDARLRLTTILLQLRQGEEALGHLQYLRRRMPDHSEILVQLAQALDLQARSAEALTVLDESLRLSPDHAGALAERGRILRRDGEHARAEVDLARAVRLDPGNVSARYQYYLTLNTSGKSDEAAREKTAIRRLETDLERIHDLVHGRLQARPNDPDLHHEVALIALRAGLPREALRWLQSAIEVDPDHAPAHRTLAAYHHETGNPILAARHRAIAQRLRSQEEKSRPER